MRSRSRSPGYQFPRFSNEPWDANWLNVRLAATVDGRSWTAEDPSLLTWEVEGLSQWLQGLADGRSVDSELAFLEPNLTFELVSTNARESCLRVWFELELRPKWRRTGFVGPRDFGATLTVSAAQLAKAAVALRGQLERHPQRGRAPGS
jgi:hypothetical protein